MSRKSRSPLQNLPSDCHTLILLREKFNQNIWNFDEFAMTLPNWVTNYLLRKVPDEVLWNQAGDHLEASFRVLTRIAVSEIYNATKRLTSCWREYGWLWCAPTLGNFFLTLTARRTYSQQCLLQIQIFETYHRATLTGQIVPRFTMFSILNLPKMLFKKCFFSLLWKSCHQSSTYCFNKPHTGKGFW